MGTAAHRAQPVADLSGGAPGHLSDDAFEDLRLAVVAAGRTRWAAAVADPSTVAGVWPLAEGEEFGHAVAEAYEEVTGDRWPGLDVAPDTGLPPAAPTDPNDAQLLAQHGYNADEIRTALT